MAKSSPSSQQRRVGRDQQKQRRPQDAGDGGFRASFLSVLTSKNVRETVESIVIAFALAFLFRTFEAEAFVIPTGSMAPTLQGRHQTVDCPMCDYSYRISASGEFNSETDTRRKVDVVAGRCPNCRYWACTNIELGQIKAEQGAFLPFNSGALQHGTTSSSANGDRIIVSKFVYEFQDPSRWDIFVFRYPGQATRNYIKRLVGLPGETVKVYRGDLYKAPHESPGDHDAGNNLDFEMARKKPSKTKAMMQIVHDNEYQAAVLRKAGWPDRWTAWPRGAATQAGQWVASDDNREFEVDGSADREEWLRYQHFVPTYRDWERFMDPEGYRDRAWGTSSSSSPKPQLISDTYAYNTTVLYGNDTTARYGNDVAPVYTDVAAMGMHWVGDLMVDCEIEVRSEEGFAFLELVEGGRQMRCQFDVATGQATLSIDGSFVGSDGEVSSPPVGQTPMKGPGTYSIQYANVDDQLVLWVDGDVIEFDAPTTYPPLGNGIPKSDAENGGDLAPVGIGSDGAAISVRGLRISRDVYYIAADPQRYKSSDYEAGPLQSTMLDSLSKHPVELIDQRNELMSNKSKWGDWFAEMRTREFPLLKHATDARKDQFLAMGDNSPQSKDGRLWVTPPAYSDFYVERDLLIGKAMIIYWPLTHIQFVR